MQSTKFRFSSALTASGWQDDVIIDVTPTGEIAAITEGGTTGHKINGIAIPAVPNVHSHAHQRFMLGLAEKAGPGADSFWTWREVMYGFALKLGPEDLEAVAAQLYMETVKSGFSVVGEFQYLHHQPDGTPYDEEAELSLRCVSAAEQAGIAITMLPTLYNFGGFGGQPSVPGQRRFVNDAGRYLRIYETLRQVCCNHPLRQLGISPHSLRAVTVDLLTEVIAGIDPASPIHIHVAEQTKEVEDCVAWSGSRPVDLMLDRFGVSPRWTAIHATHMTMDETRRLAQSGCIAGLCPTTEANLGDGIFPAVQFMQDGGAIAIGSDSHISVSPAEDIRMLEYSQRLRDRTRNALAGGAGRSTGRTLFDAVCKGGARSMAHPVGAIEVGKRCDITVLDEDHPALIGRARDDALDAWIFSGGNACVKDVIIAGTQVVKDGIHVREDTITRNFRKAVKRLTA